jgi:predicted ATPase
MWDSRLAYLLGVITSRIDRLGPSEQMTLKVASVIGREFAYRTLHDIHPIDSDREKLSQHFDTLLALDLTPLARPMPDLAYLFKHAITHDVAYNLMLYAQRRQLHRAVAEWYEHTYASDLTPYYPYLAYHWRRAADDRTPDPALVRKAIDYLHKAGEQAVHHYLNQEAIGFFNDALGLLQTLPASAERDQCELQLQLAVGAPLLETRGYAATEVQQAYARARQLSQQIGDNHLLFPALRGLWAYDIGRADYHGAYELGQQLLHLAKSEGDPSLLLEAHRALGNTVFWLGELTAAQEHMQQGIALYPTFKGSVCPDRFFVLRALHTMHS